MTYDVIGNLTYVDGPLSGTADTTRTLYNQNREVVGTIDPDPDGAGSMQNRAARITYGSTGLINKREIGMTNGQTDTAWAAFSPSQATDLTYDSNRRQTTQKLSGGGTDYALTQTSYDNRGRLQCVAVRMNTAIYGSLPSDACTLGTQGSYGPDRITKTNYDVASQVTSTQLAYGTSDQATERTLSYSDNGKLMSLTDGENNKTTYVYDGVDRLSQTQYPSATKGSGTSNSSDYEQLTYDPNSNVAALRVRDGSSIALTYDNLNRLTFKDLPGSEPDVTYAYDNLDRVTSASQTGNALSFTYDALSRNLTQGGPQGTITRAWDLAGRRTHLAYPDGYYVDYDYLVTGEVTKIRENGATSGIGVLATYAYDDLRRRTSLTSGNGTSTAYGYDPVSRLSSLAFDFAGTTNDLIKTFSYNPASQIVGETRSNDAFAFTGNANQNVSTTTNGLNQIASKGGTSFGYDSKGNLTSDGTTTYTYDSQNQLKTASGTTPPTLTYDPQGRLWESAAGTGATRYAYEGANALTQQDQTGTYWRRYVHGPGTIEPLVQYQDQNAVTRRFLAIDERGSVIALSDDSGNVTAINRYDEYGIAQAGNTGGFGYAGQRPGSTGINNDNARYYRPGEGLFMQTDPIGMEGGVNLYAYVLNDPVNSVDPFGLEDCPTGRADAVCSIFVNGRRLITDQQTWSLQQQLFVPTGQALDPSRGAAIEVVGSRIRNLLKRFFKPDPCNRAETPLTGSRINYNIDPLNPAFQSTLAYKFARHTNDSPRRSQFAPWVNPLILEGFILTAIQGSPELINETGGARALRYVFDTGSAIGVDRDLGTTRYITVGVTVIGNEGRLDAVYPGCRISE